MKVVIIIAFIVLLLVVLLPYLNFQVYINALSNLGYLGEVFAGIIIGVSGVVDAIAQYQILFTILLCYCGIFVLKIIFGLF